MDEVPLTAVDTDAEFTSMSTINAEEVSQVVSSLSPEELAKIILSNPNLVNVLGLALAKAASAGYPHSLIGWQPDRAAMRQLLDPSLAFDTSEYTPSKWKRTAIETAWFLSELAIKFTLVVFSGQLPAITVNIYNPIFEFTEIHALVFFALENFAHTVAQVSFPKKTATRLMVLLTTLTVAVFALVYGSIKLGEYLFESVIKVEPPLCSGAFLSINNDGYWQFFFGNMPFLLSQYLVSGFILTFYLLVHEYFSHKRIERQLQWNALYGIPGKHDHE